MPKLLEVKNLKTQFFTQDGVVHAVNGISYAVDKGETVAIVGESGSGKSVGVMSLIRLIPQPPGKIVDGEVWFDGQDLIKLSEDELEWTATFDDPVFFSRPWSITRKFTRFDDSKDRIMPYTCTENNQDVGHLVPNQPNLDYKYEPEK